LDKVNLNPTGESKLIFAGKFCIADIDYYPIMRLRLQQMEDHHLV